MSSPRSIVAGYLYILINKQSAILKVRNVTAPREVVQRRTMIAERLFAYARYLRARTLLNQRSLRR